MMSLPPCPDQTQFAAKHRNGAFTLIELLTACAVLSLLTVVLVSIVGKGSELWSLTESQNQYRQRARALLDFAASELRQAVIPIDGSANSFQLVVNPAQVTAFSFHDSVFWQAPIASDNSSGDLAEVGYFVRWVGTRASLCRFFANPNDVSYLIHSNPTAWISDALLNAEAPADEASNYKGLFLENVLGLWVKLFQADGTPYIPADSRQNSRLPAYAELSLALVDNATGERIGTDEVASIQTVAEEAASAQAFKDDPRLPARVQNNCSIISAMVNFDNYR